MQKKEKALQVLLFTGIALIAAWLDQLSKCWALANLGDHVPVPLIPGILEFLRIENNGAAFGILKGRMWVFFVITAVVAAGLIFVLIRVPGERRFRPLVISMGFIAAGALGNLTDRWFRHSVVDFIYFKPIDFPVFNVADIFVTTSTAVLMLLILFFYSEEDFTFLKLRDQTEEEQS